jgi:hypothetical protein
MSVQDNISYSWSRSWDRDHRTEKNYKAQFSINSMSKDKIEKRKLFCKKKPKEKKGSNLTQK